MNDFLKNLNLGVINFMGFWVPGIFSLILIAAIIIIPLYTTIFYQGINDFQNLFQIENYKRMESFFNSYKLVILTTLGVFAYLNGYLLRLYTPDKLDEISARTILKDKKKEFLFFELNRLRFDNKPNTNTESQRETDDQNEKQPNDKESTPNNGQPKENTANARPASNRDNQASEETANPVSGPQLTSNTDNQALNDNEKPKEYTKDPKTKIYPSLYLYLSIFHLSWVLYLSKKFDFFKNSINHNFELLLKKDGWPFRGKKFDRDKFPYLNFKTYLVNRGHDNISELVIWDNEQKEELAQRSKVIINTYKHEIRNACPKQTNFLESFEAHIRLMSGIWLLARPFRVIALISILVQLSIAYFFTNVPSSLNTPIFRPFLFYMLVQICFAITLFLIKHWIEKEFHYQRIRELTRILTCAATIPVEKRIITGPKRLEGYKLFHENTPHS